MTRPRKSGRPKPARPSRYRESDDDRTENRQPTHEHEKHRRRSSHSSNKKRSSHSRSSSRHSHSRSRSSSHNSDRQQSNEELRSEMQEMRAAMRGMQDTLQQIQQPTMAIPPAPPGPPTAETDTPTEPTNTLTAGMESDVMQMFRPNPRPIITAGIGIAAHVPHNVKEKIWRDEYIPLHQLLPQQSQQYTETLTLALCPDNNNQLGFRLSKPKSTTLTLDQWEDAFLVYMAVYTQRHHVCPAMCTYIRDIKDMARRNANFLYYDEQFRMERASTHCSWEAVHAGLKYQATTPFRAPQQKFQAKNQSQKVPLGYCHSYHTRGVHCQHEKCRYKHVCPTCDERHPVYRCQTKSKSAPNKTSNPAQKPSTPKDANTSNTK